MAAWSVLNDVFARHPRGWEDARSGGEGNQAHERKDAELFEKV